MIAGRALQPCWAGCPCISVRRTGASCRVDVHPNRRKTRMADPRSIGSFGILPKRILQPCSLEISDRHTLAHTSSYSAEEFSSIGMLFRVSHVSHSRRTHTGSSIRRRDGLDLSPPLLPRTCCRRRSHLLVFPASFSTLRLSRRQGAWG